MEYNSRPRAEDMMKQVGKITDEQIWHRLGVNPTNRNARAFPTQFDRINWSQKPPADRFGCGYPFFTILFSPLRNTSISIKLSH